MSVTTLSYSGLRILILCLFSMFPIVAHAIPTLGLGPFNPGTVDGNDIYNVFGNCADENEQLLDGEDCGDSNSVVRTQDIVSHIWSITVDDYTPGQDNLQNVILEQTITPSVDAEVVFEGIPVPCKDIAGGGTNPPSVLTDNGDGSWTLLCNLGEFSEAEQKSLTVGVIATGNSKNGTDYTSTQRVYSLGDDGNPNATEGVTAPIGPIKISARPAYDLINALSPTAGFKANYRTVQDVGFGPEKGFFVYKNIRLAAADKTGVEALQQPYMFQDAFSITALAEDGADYPLEFYITECRDNPILWTGEVYGRETYKPTHENGEMHVIDSGTCVFERTDAAGNPSTDPTSPYFGVTVNEANLSGSSYPILAHPSVDLSAGPYYAVNHRVQIFVPDRAIDMSDGVMNGQGSIYISSVLNDFDPNGLSGTSNYGDDLEPGYNGALVDGLRGNNRLGPTELSLTSSGNFSKRNLQYAGDEMTYSNYKNTSSVSSHAGDGELEVGQSYVGLVSFKNTGSSDMENPIACDVFDNTVQYITDRGNTGGTAGTYAYVSTYAHGGLDHTNYMVEYAHTDLTGDDPLDIDHDGATDYDASTGRYRGDWAKAAAARCDDDAPPSGWFTDPAQVPGGIDAVNMVRTRLTDAAKAAGVAFESEHELRFAIPLTARATFFGGPHDSEVVPIGTVLANFGGVRTDSYAQDWTERRYTPSPEASSSDGDRVTLTRIQIRLNSESLTPEAEPGSSASTLAGHQIVWKVITSAQSTLPDPSDAENIRIINVLQPEATYNPECTAALADGTPAQLVEFNTDKDGNPAPGYTRLSWNLGDITANTPIVPRVFCTDTDPLALHGTTVVNYAEIQADNVISPLALRSDTHSIKLEQAGSIQVSKAVDMGLDDQNDDQVHTLRWMNFAPSFTIDAPTIIDVLPFTTGGGDGSGALSERIPASDFSGKLALIGEPTVSWMDGSMPDTGAGDPHAEIGVWTYSSDAPSTINHDPDINAAEGTTNWCLEADFGNTDCPADFAEVTALKFVSNYELAKDGDPRQGMKSVMTLHAGDPDMPNSMDANLPGNLYTNRFTFDSTSLPSEQFLRSNNVCVKVAAYSIGDLVFADVNGNGKYDAGIDGTAPEGVKVELYQVTADGSETKVLETTTGIVGGNTAPGRYLFEPMASGDYYIRIPATEFQPGGLLESWDAAPPPTGAGRENEDDNEHIDQHGYTETTVNATGVRTGVITLSGTPAPPGGAPTGNEPLGDNVAEIADPRGDDFSNLTLDIGLYSPLSSIGNSVWIDSNNNGLQDPNEVGLTNVTVNLLDTEGNVLHTTQTDTSGYYDFSGLFAGTYVLEFIKPDGYEFSPQDAVADDTTDSDTSPVDGRTTAITLEFGQHDTQWDSGLYPLGSIGDQVWADTNANGLQDADELTGIAGVTVTLKNSDGDVVDTATTDADGKYLFDNLPPGDYVVDIDTASTALAGYNLTTASDSYELSLAAGEDYLMADFGYGNYASVGDIVWHDLDGNGVQDSGEPGVAGVTVHLMESGSDVIVQSVMTGADGKYLFENVTPGDYVIEFVQPTDYAGFTAHDLGGDSTLDSNAIPSSGLTGTFNLAGGQDRTDIDAGLYQTATVGNLLWLDEDGDGTQGIDEPGLPGTQVILTGTLGDGSTFTSTSVVTDGSGQYHFADLYPGEYTVTFADVGFVPANQGSDDALDSDVSPSGVATVTLASGEDNETIDAGISAAAVTGRVWIDNNTHDHIDNGPTSEQGIIGVNVNLIDTVTGDVVATTTTGTEGVYSFTGVKPGNYLVEVIEPTDTNFVDQDQGVDDTSDSDVNVNTGRSEPFSLLAAQTVTDIDAGIEPGALGDHVALDMNNNGIQDAGEPGVEGVVVTLIDANGVTVDTQTTDSTGFYNFSGIAPGDYTVNFDAPINMDFAAQDVGSNDIVDFDTDAAGDVSVTVVSGVGDQTVDAGIVPAMLGDTVWFDTNGNGVQDAGEPGIADMTVTLLDEGGIPVEDAGGNPITTLTDVDGKYSFSVLPGVYKVEFDLPADLAFTPADQGGDDTKDSDAAANGQTPAVKLASGDSDISLDAGIAPAVVRGKVFSDANGSGTEDGGDTELVSVTVTLKGTDVLGNLVEMTTVTNEDGYYQFDVMPGTYELIETNPSGLTSSGSEAGTVGSTVINEDIISVVLKSGDVSKDNDFLDYELASLSGQVREDSNADADTTDTTDVGISGVEIILWKDSNGDGTPDSVYANTTTNTAGEYSFLDIPPGDYVVIETDPESYSSTGDTEGDNDNRIVATVASGEVSPDHDFLDTRSANISGQVRDDTDRDGDLNDTELGISGLTVTLYTDPNGDGDPTDGVVVTTTTTNTQGEYEFHHVLPGDYVVVETDGNDTESTADTSGDNDNQIPVTLVADKDSTDNDFLDASLLGSLSGVVWADDDSDGTLDSGESGIPNVTVVVKGMAGNIIATLSTDADGAYDLDNMPAGSYQVVVNPATLPAGVIQTGDPDATLNHETIAAVVAGSNTDELDFGYVGPSSIGDRVWHDKNLNGIQDATEAGVANVAVKLLDGSGSVITTTLTDASGDYEFAGLLKGDYTLEFVKPANFADFSPVTAGSDTSVDSNVVTAVNGQTGVISLGAGEVNKDIDAGLYQLASLGDFLWFDTNGNGLQDVDEPGIPDITVTLTSDGMTPQTVVTDDTGQYLFEDLVPGDYEVNFTLPVGMAFTDADQGNDDTNDSDVSASGTAAVTLESGEHNHTLDAGVLPAELSGRVWVDNNTQNGIDEGTAIEKGVVGVNINLIDTTTGNAILTTTTGADGVYTFSGVLPGEYIVEVVEPANMGFVSQDQGGDDTVDSDVDPQNGRSAPFTINSGDSVGDIDAGIAPGELGDRVWLDENNNGLQDAGEPGVPGLTVNLLDSNGDTLATQVTDSTGFYNFEGVLPGEYEIEFVTLSGMALTEQDRGTDDSLDSDADVTTKKAAVTVISGVGDQTIDTGIIPATLGDTIWFDANNNGLQDAGEISLGGVTVNLIDATGNAVLDAAGNPVTTQTDENGQYQFIVLPGSYGIHVDLPTEAALTVADAGDDVLDSDAVPTTGKSAAVTVISGDNVTSLDAGIKAATINGTVIIDNDADGIEDADDTVTSPGVTLTVSGTDAFGNAVTETVVTDADGNYSTNVPPGTYTVTETTPDGLTSTGSEAGTLGSTVVDADNLTVTVGSGDVSEENDFLNSAPASLSGQVREDSNGDGDLSDGTDTPMSGVEVFLWLDTNQDGNPDSVVSNTITNASGNYAFTDLAPGHYIVLENDPDDYVSTGDTDTANDNKIAVTLASSEQSPGHDFLDTKTANISGQVRDDADRDGDVNDAEAGLPGLTVTLFTDPNGDGDPSDGIKVATDSTDAQGDYEFVNIAPGAYVVVETDPSEYESTADSGGDNDNRVPVALTSGTDSTDNDFLDTSVLGSLSGTVWNDANTDGDHEATESGLPGVTVRVTDGSGATIATLVTDANGEYSVTDLPAGSYQVEVDNSTLPTDSLQTGDPDTVLNHMTQATVVAGANTPDLDFGYVAGARVGDRVWEDLNGNGVQDAGEPGISNVAVVLSKDGEELSVTRTDADGLYHFDDLLPATYEVSFEWPNDYYLTTADQGSDDALDSDANSAGKASVTLASGDNLSVDAGLYRYGALGDAVWLDMNSNGIQDADESAISEVVVNLLDTAGDPQLDGSGQPISTSTNAQGEYLFTGLRPGDYLVEFVAPAGISFTRTDAGVNDAVDSDAQPNGQAPGVVVSGETNRTVDAGILPAEVSGRIWIDNNSQNALDDGPTAEDGVVGVNINLIDVETGNAILTTTTGTDGIYTFNGVLPGDYRVEVAEPANMGFVAQDQGTDDTIDSDINADNGRSPAFTVNSGDSVTNIDAGIAPGELGDRVWLDENNNGLQDAGEPGVPGLTVNLLDSNGDTLATQVTDSTGFYNFAGVLPGDYEIAFVVPDGMTLNEQNQGTDDSLDSDADVTTKKAAVTVISGVGDQTIDAGIIPATLGDTIWFDANNNGLQDAGEAPLGGVTVNLIDANGNAVLDAAGNPVTTQTDENGQYHFIVLPGRYGIHVDLPLGTALTTMDAGDDVLDSDAVPTTGKSAAVTVISGDSVTSLDAGIKAATINGTVIIDNDADGIEDADDTVTSPGVTLTVSGTDVFGNAVTETVVTDADGNYSTNVPPGTYTVTETTPDGLTSTGSEAGTLGSTVVDADNLTVTVGSGDVSEENDFLNSAPASLSGQVREDSNGDGDLSDGTDTPMSGVEVFLWLDTNQDGNPDSVVGNTITNASGNYAFTDLAPGHYIVLENDPDDYVSTGDTDTANDNKIAVTLSSSEQSLGHDFLDTKTANISGQVRDDADRDGDLNDAEAGLPGLTVTLFTDPNGDGDPSDGIKVATDSTDAQGDYEFVNIAPGAYVVVETDPSEYESTADSDGDNDNRVPVALTSGTDSTDNDFLDTSVLGSLSGTVWNDANTDGDHEATESGLPGVTVRVTDGSGATIATLVTDANGDYSVTDLPAGSYQVEVDNSTLPTDSLQTGDPDTVLNHMTQATVVAGANTPDLDFGYVAGARVGDRVWEDLNGNGVQDAGEPGISNVAVILSKDGEELSVTRTDADGLYHFDDLLPATYEVSFEWPNDYYLTTADQGSDDALDSDANSAGKASVTLASGDNLSVDAGLYRYGALGDAVWLDMNSNGIQDADESAISEVVVNLLDTAGDPQLDGSGQPISTSTNAQGEYLFTGLRPGDYLVEFVAPAGISFTRTDAGVNDAVDSDAQPNGQAPGVVVSGETNRTVDAGILPAEVSGRIWIDNNSQNALDDGPTAEDGVVGVNINLIDVETGNAILTTTTGTDGIYTFNGVLPGDYIVEVAEPANMGFVAQDQGTDDTIDSDINADNGRSPAFTVNSGDSVTNIDAGIAPGELGDRVWLDENNNGLQDAGEPGVPGLTVNLLDSNGDTLATQVTDSTGFYNFAGVLPGDYEIAFVVPDGMTLNEQNQGTDDSLDSDADVTTKKAAVTVISGVGDQTIDAGIIPATLGDTIWFDANNNGLQDAGEAPLGGVTVNLIDATGNAVLDAAGNPVTTQTDENGQYHFIVLPGRYGIHVDLPLGTALTTMDAGDDVLDSDAVPTTGKSAAVTVISGDNVTSLDAGIKAATINGTVIIDNDADGIEDADDTVTSPGVTLTVSGTDAFGNAVTETVVTDADGNYSTNVPPGTYTVTETTPDGLTSTGSEAGTLGSTVVDADNLTVTVGSGDVSEENDFLNSAPASLSGQVREDSNGDGDLNDGTDTPMSGVEVFLWLDTNQDGNPDSVVGNTITNASGNYAFTDLAPGHYIVLENDPDDYVSTGDTDTANDNKIVVTLASSQQSPGHDFLDTKTANISGQVRDDADRDGDVNDAEAGLPGLTVTLFTDPNGDGDPSDGIKVATDSTDAQGDYEFVNIAPGAYVVVETDPSEYESTADSGGDNDNRVPVALTSGTDSTDNDFLDTSVLGSLSGTVWNDANTDGDHEATESGLPGVTVRVINELGVTVATLVTDASGGYSVIDLPLGGYRIEVDPDTLPVGSLQTGDPDSELNHATQTLVTAGQNTGDLDFGYVAKARLGDLVWEDLNGNGVQDAGEPGIANAVVVLSQEGNNLVTTHTNRDGKYHFDNLMPGDYEVTFKLPEGYYLTNVNQGANDALDSDPSADGKVRVTLTSGDDLSLDAGLYRYGALGDTVWLDMNGDGVRNSDDPAISDVVVNLLDTSGNPLLDDAGQPISTTTDANGEYLFTDLRPGDYLVGFVAPTGISFTAADQGLNDTLDSDAMANGQAPATVVSDQTNLTVDAGIVPAGVSGRIWIDNNAPNNIDEGVGVENGVVGVAINLVNASSGEVVATTTTGTDGLYNFAGVEPGDYWVQVTEPAHMGFVAPNQGSDDTIDSDVDSTTGRTEVFTLTSGSSVTDIDAGIEPGALGDHVFLDENENGLQDSGESGVEGVTVELLDANDAVIETQMTDATGFYDFSAGLPGEYTVKFTLPDGMTFTQQDVGSNDTLDSDVDTATGEVDVNVVSGVGNQTVDAGVVPAKLGDTVWLDIDSDGTQGGTEPILANVEVVLLDDSGDPALDKAGNAISTVTDATGFYQFIVEPGTYGTRFVLPEGTEFTTQYSGNNGAADSDADLVTGDTAMVTVSSGDNNNTLDAGIKPSVISGKVLQDNNGSEAEDATDTPLSGVTVTLEGTDNFGNPISQTTVTEPDGSYHFDIPPGTYTVTETNPDDYTSSVAEAGTAGSTVINKDIIEVVVNSGESSGDNDFLDYQLASLSGQVREDMNGDGDAADSTDPVLAGVELVLWSDTNTDGVPDVIFDSTTTDASGEYRFDDLPPGNYVVLETDPAGHQSTADTSGSNDNQIPVLLVSGEHSSDHEFLDARPTIVSGQVREDDDRDGDLNDPDTGLTDVVVTLYTDPNGDGDPEDGEPVAVTETDNNGNYHFDGIMPGSYVVVETDPEDFSSTGDSAGEPTDNSVPVTNVSGENDTGNDLLDAKQLGGVSGTVWNDRDADETAGSTEPKLAGISVALLDKEGNTVATTVTDGYGSYSFTNLIPGDYTVLLKPETLPSGFAQTGDPDDVKDGRHAITVAPQADVADVDFGYVVTSNIGDRVWHDLNANGVQEEGESGLPGVTVKLFADLDGDGVAEEADLIATTATDTQGLYQFPGLLPDDYVLHFETLQNHYISPATQGTNRAIDSNIDINSKAVVALVDEGNLTIDAGMWQLGSLGNRVWLDENLDGYQDAGEASVSDVAVSLHDMQGVPIQDTAGQNLVTTTDASGSYRFDNLVPGEYQVRFTTPSDITFTQTDKGTNDTLDSDTNANGYAAGIVTSAQHNDTVDAGLVPASVNGRIWIDNYSQNALDDGIDAEAGLVGMVVNLLDNNGDVLYSTTSGADGTYRFVAVLPGDYQVEFVEPDNMHLVEPDQGNDDARDSDAAVSTGRTPMFTLESGDGVSNLDAGIKPGAIGDRVWLDANQNGVQDADEPGVPNIDVHLLDQQGLTIKSTKTDENGFYSFNDIIPDDYIIRVDRPTNMDFVPKDIGDDDTADSDVDVNGAVAVTVYSSTSGDQSIDAGIVPAVLGDRVWLDMNLDHLQSDGEPGLQGITVNLLDNKGDVVDSTITDATGFYQFAVIPGEWQVAVVAPDSQFVDRGVGADHQVDSDVTETGLSALLDLESGESEQRIDAGVVPGLITGIVVNDINGDGQLDNNDNPLPNVTVTVMGTDSYGNPVTVVTTTDDDGEYELVLPPGTYTVTETQPEGFESSGSHAATTPSCEVVSVDEVSVVLESGWIGEDVRFFDYQPASIEGQVMDDPNGDGDTSDGSPHTGVTVTLYTDPNGDGDPADGVVVDETTTDNEGTYQFDDLPPGDYVLVEIDPDNTLSTTDNTLIIDLSSGETNEDTTFIDVHPVSFGGTVQEDSNGNGTLDGTDASLSGVTVALYTDPNGDGDPSDGEQVNLVMTNDAGEFQFGNVLPGHYVVVETDPDKYSSVLDSTGGNDNQIPLAVVSGQIPDSLVFLDVEPLNDLTGTVYNDADGDADVGDPDVGIPGVTVELWSDPNNDGNPDDGVLVASTTTDENGNYSFPDVASGNWVIIEVNPLGYVSTGDAGGANDDQVSLAIEVENGQAQCTKRLPITADDSCTGLFFMDRPLNSLISLSKTAYHGHDGGAKCGTGAAVDVLTVVDLDRNLQEAITYCFEVENTGENYLRDIELRDDVLGITGSQMTALGSVVTVLPPVSTDATTIMRYFYESTLTSSIVNTATVSAVPALADGTAMASQLSAVSTASVDVSLVLDPPSAFKTVTTQGPLMEWRMVWINSSSRSTATLAVYDDVPLGTVFVAMPAGQYVSADGIHCEARGSSVTESCYLEAPGEDYPQGRIIWRGKVGADVGHYDEGSALNEVIIRFTSTLEDEEKSQIISNQAHSSWDLNGDGQSEYVDVTTDDNTTSQQKDSTVVVFGDKNGRSDTVQIPTLSEWAMIMLSLLILLISAGRLRRN